MCGLIVVKSKKGKRAGGYAFDLYNKQKSRGQKGFGYIAIQDGRIVSVERAKTEAYIKSLLLKETADFILFHHRFPTSTENHIGTTHPMYVSHEELEYDYYIAHNGVISNDDALKKKHNELGYEYNTEHSDAKTVTYLDGSSEILESKAGIFNDSETLAIELARYIEGLSSGVGAVGPSAFWCIQIEKNSDRVVQIFYGRNYGRELCKKDNNKWLVISSETGALLEPMKLYSFEPHDLVVSTQDLDINEAKPIPKTTGYHTPHTYLPSRSTEDRFPVLENRKYSYVEVQRTGYPFSDFETVWEGVCTKYIPKKYTQTKELVWVKSEEAKLEGKEKELERLEKLALEYVAAKAEIDDLDQKLTDGQIDWDTYHDIYRRKETDMEIARDLMSALGLPEKTIEDKIDELEDELVYNVSYNVK